MPALREPFQLALAERAVRLSAGQRFRVLSRYRMQLAASDGLVVEAALDGEPALRLRQYLVGYSERAFVLTGEASAKAYEKAAPLFDAVAATARFGEERTDG
ncbi:MAG: hypothetical protein HUU35_10035 [Armatimonadetes bacterium]|nr:hypothetical protein [Armatimonadota bacterium]